MLVCVHGHCQAPALARIEPGWRAEACERFSEGVLIRRDLVRRLAGGPLTQAARMALAAPDPRQPAALPFLPCVTQAALGLPGPA